MGSVEAKLRQAGLDTDFLAWLEGKADRLPRLGRVHDITPKAFGQAILAATWIRGHIGPPDANQGRDPHEWSRRYLLLEHFLFSAFKDSISTRRQSRLKDLQCLETIIVALLPIETAREYLQDIKRFVQCAKPLGISHERKRPKGGPRESEQTRRMRAAIDYVAQVSDQPYHDLAEFWTDRSGTGKQYHGDEIRNRLRRGIPEGAQSLELWRGVYNGEWWRAFPGPFPLPSELSRVSPEVSLDIANLVQLLVAECPEVEDKLQEIVDCLARKERGAE
jgi:hypothetical protein